MIYPTSEQTPDQVDHVYQIENTSTHVPLPSSSAAVLAKNTKLQATVKTRSSEATTSKTNSLSEVTPATIVDRADFLSGYVDETGVTTQSVTSDKEAVRKAKTCLWEQFLVCTHLRGYSETDREATLRKLDKRVRKLLTHVGENALVTVLLSGRGSGATCQNALCLTKIT
ncbi:hypothetical protein NP493_648g00002 [Ridgeia piscesae]|uniref:Uncharacterized protein n=1 Tax=Ridgeia piscesae TaxID=27915 RepID=A0AAD9KSG8_RIDPI|nr:hypothetical protein NP493_648g00002 [Ridgeia piscesae]